MTLYVVFLQVLFRFGEQQGAHIMSRAAFIENIARKGNMSKAEAKGAVTVTGWCQLRVASSFLL